MRLAAPRVRGSWGCPLCYPSKTSAKELAFEEYFDKWRVESPTAIAMFEVRHRDHVKGR